MFIIGIFIADKRTSTERPESGRNPASPVDTPAGPVFFVLAKIVQVVYVCLSTQPPPSSVQHFQSSQASTPTWRASSSPLGVATFAAAAETTGCWLSFGVSDGGGGGGGESGPDDG